MPAVLASRARVEYKKPSRLNAVSLALLLVVCGLGYVGYSFLPLWRLRSAVKSELAQQLPDFWRANLRPDAVRIPETARIKRELAEKLRKVGVKDPKLEIKMVRSPKSVMIEARFNTTVHFPGLDKKKVIACAPQAETDAARIEW
jgi:hypothetical protein